MSDKVPPVGLILWAGNNSAHHNHLHVEPPSTYRGYTDGRGDQPPTTTSGMTDGVRAIYDALVERFGVGRYFTVADGADWTHMGWYNRRPISGSKRWSQHAWGNAIDIGPYYGVKEQEEFYNFLTGREEQMDAEYEVIAGYKWYDYKEWPTWADSAIRKNIAAGIIRGIEIDPNDPTKRVFGVDEPLTRAQMAVVLDRIDVV